MKLIPLAGLKDVSFGTKIGNLIDLFGLPHREQILDDVETHPKCRKILIYENFDLLVTPKLGLIDVESIDCGIIASFCGNKLESIEINNPVWRKTIF